MNTKFFETFTQKTNGKYKMLKLSGAKYVKNTNLLTVNFIISAFEVQSFSDEQKKDVQSVIERMFEGVKVEVVYTRTYADNHVVMNKILEFFNSTNPMIFHSIKESNTVLRIDESEIHVLFKFETPMYKMFTSGNLSKELADYLDCRFIQTISIRVEEVETVNKGEFTFNISSSATSGNLTTLRLISVDMGDRMMSRGRAEGISQLPGYIADVKSENKNCVLCGKVSNISKRTYFKKNKEGERDESKKMPIIKFMIDDTTGKIECTCFPRLDVADDLEAMLNTTPEVVCMGEVTRYNGSLAMTASSVFACKIDYDSIDVAKGKPVPCEYRTVFPENYVSMTQQSFIDDDSNRISPYFAGKTLVIFDLETTSKFPESADIIQISALKVVDGIEKQTFTTFVKPPKSIPPEIVELTDIDDALVADAPKIADVIPDFYRFADGAILVGHNILGYDYPIIKRIGEDMGYKFNNELEDTLLLSRKYLTEMSNHKLTTLSKALKIEHENAHRADADVLATWGVLKEIARRMDR